MKNNCPHRKPAHRGFSLFQVLGAGLFLCCAPSCAGGAEKKNIQFNRDIRAILSDNCYSCHGPDKDKRKAKLRVDTREGLFTKIKANEPVVPGNLAEREIYRRITS